VSPKKGPLGVNGRITPALLVAGLIVVAAVAVIGIGQAIVGGGQNTPLGSAPFSYDLNVVGSSRAGSEFVYNISIVWTSGGANTNWTEFHLINSSAAWVPTEQNFTVMLANQTGAEVGLFNSTQSSWTGNGWSESTQYGGWVVGTGVPVQAGDSFELVSPLSASVVVLAVETGSSPSYVCGTQLAL
jgi:hypothetical protein